MKHKKLTMIVALVLVVALAAGLGIWATGETNVPTVTYYDGSDGTNAHFTFTHTGKGSDTNLFPNFSNCMPGDSLTQTIRVQADSKNGVQGAKIYLRAEIDGNASAKEDSAISYNDVLDHIGMTVSKNGVVIASSKTAKFFSQLDAADDKSNVFIAEVSPKTDPVDLDVTIDVDPAMGNAFQEAAAHITFAFSVEDNELPPPPLEREKHDAYICGYPDGTVKPERQITRAEVATIFYRLLQDEARENVWSRTNSYSDVTSGAWYNSAVSTLTNAGILAGYPDGTFRPNAPITRAEFATIAARFYHAPEVTGDAFSDISGSWAREYINRAAALGLIDGYPGSTLFRPNQNIKRDEAMKIINKVLFRTPDKDHFLSNMITWPDNSDPDAWYYTDVQEATNNHDYERVNNTSTETWTKITPARDWQALEAELAQKYPNR